VTRPLLDIRQLVVHFGLRRQWLQSPQVVHAVNGVSLAVQSGETLGLVGESGCGKSTLAKAVMQLCPSTAGSVFFDGQSLGGLSYKALRAVRRHMQMVFQDPFESLNPRHTVGSIVEEPLVVHGVGSREVRRQRVLELLDLVELPASSFDRYPHEFSGGQRQRVGIARAIALEPRLLVCDEPVSALDVSVQAQILNLLLKLQQSLNLTMLFISHDLAVIRHVSDRVAVMYLGKIVELADVKALTERPLHPYTQALFAAIPLPRVDKKFKAVALQGEVPSAIDFPTGCVFASRCPFVQVQCQEAPELKVRGKGSKKGGEHWVACHFEDLVRSV